MPSNNEPLGGWYQTEPRDQQAPVPVYTVLAESEWLKAENRATQLGELNQELAQVGWSLKRESAPEDRVTEPVVTALLLTGDVFVEDPAQTPQAALRALPSDKKRHAFLDEMLIDGLPAHKPGVPPGTALTRGDFGRIPVALLPTDPPPRRTRAELRAGRRPVIALFDTAVGRHPWLDGDPNDPIWLNAADYGLNLGPRAPEPADLGGRSVSEELDSHFGHGTFSAGLIRRIASDALVLLLPIMHDDGMVHADHLLNALGWIRDGKTHGEAPADQDPRPYVDVISLPLGYEFEFKDRKFADWLRRVLGELGELGVQVVASAGNEGKDAETYPAAFAVAKNLPGTPLVSVGALNPNGRTRANYSNHGDWVTDWAIGTSVVSTFPLIDGPASPEIGSESRDVESVDPDDFTGGFSRWSGTSFAATAFAAMLGQALLTTGALADPTLTAHERAKVALVACRKRR
jgi:hypothetical protein